MSTRWQKADQILRDPGSVRALLADPPGWLRDNGLSEADIACTDEAHDALDRAEAVAAKANELESVPLLDALPKLRGLATSAWGDEVTVSRIPFGVALAQRVTVPTIPIIDDNPEKRTGTASVRCTFGLSCKADVDD